MCETCPLVISLVLSGSWALSCLLPLGISIQHMWLHSSVPWESGWGGNLSQNWEKSRSLLSSERGITKLIALSHNFLSAGLVDLWAQMWCIGGDPCWAVLSLPFLQLPVSEWILRALAASKSLRSPVSCWTLWPPQPGFCTGEEFAAKMQGCAQSCELSAGWLLP